MSAAFWIGFRLVTIFLMEPPLVFTFAVAIRFPTDIEGPSLESAPISIHQLLSL